MDLCGFFSALKVETESPSPLFLALPGVLVRWLSGEAGATSAPSLSTQGTAAHMLSLGPSALCLQC